MNREDHLEIEKKIAAEKALTYISSGMIVGLGTGTTAKYFIELLGERVQKGLDITAVPSSEKTASLARELGIKIDTDPRRIIDVDVDGADEIDLNGNMIKGGGGALWRERVVASNSNMVIIIADHTKLVDKIGNFPVPIEISKFMVNSTLRHLKSLSEDCSLRDGGRFITDNGNLIVDCSFRHLNNPAETYRLLKSVPGVIDVGIFLNIATLAILGQVDLSLKTLTFKKTVRA